MLTQMTCWMRTLKSRDLAARWLVKLQTFSSAQRQQVCAAFLMLAFCCLPGSFVDSNCGLLQRFVAITISVFCHVLLHCFRSNSQFIVQFILWNHFFFIDIYREIKCFKKSSHIFYLSDVEVFDTIEKLFFCSFWRYILGLWDFIFIFFPTYLLCVWRVCARLCVCLCVCLLCVY